MRSHSSSHSHSHSHSHSSISRRSSMHSHSMSRSRSSSMHRSSLASRHHSSLAGRSHSSQSRMRSNLFNRHGISNAHAFVVGKTTGVNINGSAMGAHGAALHHSRVIRRHSSNSSLNKSRRRYTMNRNKYGINDGLREDFCVNANAGINDGMFVWIIMFLFILVPIIMFVIMTMFITRITGF